MMLARCDVCCDVLDGIDDGIVYDCSQKVYNETGIEHICKDCIHESDDLILTNNKPYSYVVEIKGDNYDYFS